MKPYAQSLTLAVVAIAASAVSGCSKAMPPPFHCASDAGGEHDETVTVTPGQNNGTDFEQCVLGNCYSLCTDVKGSPGDGSRVNIVICDLISVEEIDAGTDIDGGGRGGVDANVKPDASAVVAATAVTVHIVYDVYPCSPAD